MAVQPYRFFVTPAPKNRIFQWTPIILKFFILTPYHLLKATKLLIKISRFKFLVMTEKNIFVYKLFLSFNISDFSLFFMSRLQSSLKKVTVSHQPPSKNWDPVKPPLTENLGGGSTAPPPPPPSRKDVCGGERGGTLMNVRNCSVCMAISRQQISN